MSSSLKPDPIVETIKVIKKESQIFKDEMSKVWVSCELDRIQKTIPVNSEMFKLIIQKKYFEIDETPASQATVNRIKNFIHSEGLFGENVEKVFIRNAYDSKSNYFVDLGNKVVKITSSGYFPINRKNAPNFFQPPGFKELPYPSNQKAIDKLKGFINVSSDNDFRLIIAWLLSALNPKIPTPILILQGEHGSAKSTLSKVLRNILDPNKVPLKQCPGSERDMFISAINSPVLVWDNLSGIKDWASDSLCRLATGGGYTTRKLYTDTDETIIEIMRPIILNGIDTIATRGDLLDRAIVLNLPIISREDRKTEESFWTEFGEILPEITSSLYSAFSFGLKNIDNLDIKKLPRMADFAKWSTTCCNYYSWPKNVVIDDYNKNRRLALETSISNDIFAQTLLKLLRKNPKYENTAENFLEDLKALTPHSNLLPDSKKLKNKLTRLSPILREFGYVKVHKRTSEGSLYAFSKS